MIRAGVKRLRGFRGLIAVAPLLACAGSAPPMSPAGSRASGPGSLILSDGDSDGLLIVDCLLPGQIRKLGSKVTYATPRRPVRTTAIDCEIRGGEYVAYDRADLSTSLAVWLGSAEQGDSAAQNYVGEIYEKGLGVPSDFLRAAAWYRRAAEAGYARAQINLGQLYDRGLGVPHDPVEALRWYARASGLEAEGVPFLPAAASEPSDAEGLAELERRANEARTLRSQVQALEGEVQRLRAETSTPATDRQAAEEQIAQERSEIQAMREGLGSEARALRDARILLEGDRESVRASRTRLAADLESLTLREREFAQRSDELEAREAELEHARASDDQEARRIAAARRDALDARAVLAAEQRNLGEERSRLEALERRARASQEALAERETQLASDETRVGELSEALERREVELAERARTLASREEGLDEREEVVGVREQEIEFEARELAAKRAELDRMELEIAGLRREAQEAQRVDPVEASPVVLAGPSIELIEPPIQFTRGVEIVASHSAAGERVVVGQVDAPAGLLALTVNDSETPVGLRGIFQHRMAVPHTGVLVKVVAVDRQGKRASREFRLAPSVERAAPPPPQAPAVAFGNYVALVIGNDDYRSLPDLTTAVADARSIAELLEQRYGFRVQLLLNANRYQTLSALNQLRGSLTENDNLLIYYAGHGELDKVNGRGFWLPVDAEPTSTANWISNVAITDILNSMAARHVLVVADSCYSGALTRSALARLEAGMTEEARRTWIRAMLKKRSRTALTSGGLEPVLDSGGGRHSIFARVLIEVLEQNREVLEGQRIFREVAARVTWAAEGTNFEQVPQYAPIKFAGHESGDFFFVPQGG